MSTTTGSAPLSKASDQLALESPLVGRRREGVGQQDGVDVRRDRVRHGPRALERRPTGERRAARQDVVDALAVR